jgi:hypothetical protein
MTDTAHLYEITDELLAILDAEEFDEEKLAQAQGEFKAKAGRVARYVQFLQDQERALSQRSSHFATAAAARGARAERLKEYLARQLDAVGAQAVTDGITTISFRKTPARVVVDEGAEIPAEFQRVIPERREADKALIGGVLKAGKELPFAHLEQGRSLTIKEG